MGTSEGEAHVSGELTPSAITYSPNSRGQWDLKRAQHELKAQRATYQQAEEAKAAEFSRQQEAKTQDHRRRLETVAFSIAMLLTVGALICGLYLIMAEDDATRQQAGVAIVSVIVGGIVSGIGGYIAGRGTK